MAALDDWRVLQQPYYAPQGETAMNLDLMLLIDKQFLDTPFYGVRQMTWHLQNEGHAVNQKRIRRLMRLMRLMPIYQKPDTSRPAKGHKTYQNSPCPVGTRIDRARDYDEVPVDPRLEAQTRQTQREMDARNRAARQDAVTTQVFVTPRGEDARDRQRRLCAEARAYREREIERVGLRRTYDLLSRLDRMVFDACKGL